ncbi:type II toxin-antitoxin system VapB family antitoxin [Erwinia mallotivora]|uniref:type II toxin-antitoxin system VapB family antitoxin n=1 Tax=Erwinia mallotivora TaxID=69222 RepID=UPI0021BE1311|nr:type II toxin-antitoxin system VapB family antitoxin [Erwinia mallotivora]
MKTTLFFNHCKLAKAIALPDNVKYVDIVAVGRTRIISPAGEIWNAWFEEETASADFMLAREQPGTHEREDF